MEHVAIMRKSWGLTDKIITGQKTIESRWYKSRYPPWDLICAGDTVYFKNSGEPVKIMAEVTKVAQFSDLSPHRVKHILNVYGKRDGIPSGELPRFFDIFKDKRYCVLVFLQNAKKTAPFEISKKGYGSMASWMVVDDIGKLKAYKSERRQ